jgi:hypothetical protein
MNRCTHVLVAVSQKKKKINKKETRRKSKIENQPKNAPISPSG